MKKTCFTFLSHRLTMSLLTGAVMSLSSLSLLEAAGNDNPNNPDKVCKYERKCGTGEDEQTLTHEVKVKKDEACPSPAKLNLGKGWKLVSEASLKKNNGYNGKFLISTGAQDNSNGTLSNELPAMIAGGFSPNYVSLENLKLYGDGVEVLRDSNTNIRQIMGLDYLIDIISPGPRKIEIKLFKVNDVKPGKNNGLYSVNENALPMKKITYEQIEDNFVSTEIVDNSAYYPSINKEEIRQTIGEDLKSLTLEKTYYKGRDLTATAYKKETTKISSVVGGQPYEEKFQIQTEEMGSDGSWYVVGRKSGRRAIYKEDKGFVPLYTCDAVDENGNPIENISTETTYTYYTNELDFASFGKIRTLRQNNGYWENKYYDLNTHAGIETEKTESPWLDTEAHEPGAQPGGSIRIKTKVICETDNGTEGFSEVVDGKYLVNEWSEKSPVDQDKVKIINYVTHSGGTKITTTVRYRQAKDVPVHLRGKLISIDHADGVKEKFSYELQDDTLIIAHDKGYGNNSSIVNGLSTISKSDVYSGNLKEETVYAITAGGEKKLISSKIGVQFDNEGLCLKWIYNNDPSDYSSIARDCCKITHERQRDGSETSFIYDGGGNLMSTTKSGVTISYERKGLKAVVWKQEENGTNKFLVREINKNLAGMEIEEKYPSIGEHVISVQKNNDISRRSEEVVSHSGQNATRTYFKDGQLARQVDYAGVAIEFNYVPNTSGAGKTTIYRKEDLSKKEEVDGLGNLVSSEFWNGAVTKNKYNTAGQLVRSESPDGEIWLYEYGSSSTISCLDKNRNGTIDMNNDYIISQSVEFDAAWPNMTGSWKKTEQQAISGSWVITNQEWETEDKTQFRANNRKGEGFIVINRPKLSEQTGRYEVVNVFPDGVETIKKMNRQNGFDEGYIKTVKDANGGIVSTEEIIKDKWGNIIERRDPVSGSVRYSYDIASGKLLAMVDGRNRSTEYTYDNSGNNTSIMMPDGSIKYFEYDSMGNLTKKWGSLQPPIRFEYDSYGRKTGMWTYRIPVTPSMGWPEAEGDKTAWKYDKATGRLTEKIYPDGKTQKYGYSTGGKLISYRNEDNSNTLYNYDPMGNIVSIRFDEQSQTPIKEFTYDQMGRLTRAATGSAATYIYHYDERGNVVREDITYGYNGLQLHRQIARSYDRFGRKTGYKLKNMDTVEQDVIYEYDSSGRINSINANGKTFAYTYAPMGAGKVESFKSPVHKAINTYDPVTGKILSKRNSWLSGEDNIISSFEYERNDLDQKILSRVSGSAFGAQEVTNNWAYDRHGNVIQDNLISHSYDQSGNRIATGNGDSSISYLANARNQYTTINGTGISYDNRGNQLTGMHISTEEESAVTATYNAEDRLTGIYSGETLVTVYSYDHRGRKTKSGDKFIVYDGYNAIAEYKAGDITTLDKLFAWGLDTEGSLELTGGVGALLCVVNMKTQMPLTSYPAYDGTGNISEYLIEGNIINAHYMYDAFGNQIGGSGNMNYDYRYNTKYYEQVTNTYYYNFRSYDPHSGRWLSKEPLTQEFFLWKTYGDLTSGNKNLAWLDNASYGNLYSFISNDAINNYDYLGLLVPGGDWGGRPSTTPSQGNCYRYVCNDPTKPGEDHNPFPGGDKPPFPEVDCAKAKEGAIKDGMIESTKEGKCKECYYKTVLVLSMPIKVQGIVGRDPHWFRQDDDGTWSHKPGQQAPETGVSDPEEYLDGHKKNPNPKNPMYIYTTICGYFCVPDGGIDTDK